MPIQVLLADDHQIVRDGMKVFLEREGFKVHAEAQNGQEAISLALKLQPEVVVLDITMPVLNGLDAAREILRQAPATKAILLTMHDDSKYVLEGLRLGVKGFVTKTHAAEDLLQAIRQAMRGTTYVSPELSQAVFQAIQSKSDVGIDPLTARERQVLQLVAEGKTTKESAEVLHISIKTAETHRAHIMEKLNIHETAGLVRYAIRRGLVRP
ncbi:MAG: response regulator transcription factor [Acidobacteria bacterium]|nr:response regulator transcription factor [Acidobacteriota bacterium]